MVKYSSSNVGYSLAGSTFSYTTSNNNNSVSCCGRRAAGSHMQCGSCPHA